jgi:hypothetical protein
MKPHILAGASWRSARPKSDSSISGERDVDAISKIRGAREAAAGGLHQRRRRLREPGKPRVRDRLIEDAGLALLVLDRRQISYEDALEGLVRDACGSADRLRAAVAEARASGRPDAELDLLERAADRIRAETRR